MGSLTNLQFLILRSCRFLTTLPKSITKLHNLRSLSLKLTPLSYIPKGISKLENINELIGFVVADPREPADSYSSLEELLTSLYQLRRLSISKMERAQKGALTLQKLTHLVDLELLYTEVTADGPPPTEEDITRIEDVLEELCPPPCLERLYIFSFFGGHYPCWMKSPSFGERLPHLTVLNLLENISCPQLPPAGELPQLSELYIENAYSVKSIGPEFLGVGVRDDTHTSARTNFPNLRTLTLSGMLELEEWTFNKEIEGRGKTQVLPQLDNLIIDDCPKLKALPKGLEQSKMKTLDIHDCHSLTAVENLPNLMEELSITNNKSLERVSHLPALQVLTIYMCPALNCVENLDSLRHLKLDDVLMKEIPKWLTRLLEERKPADDDDDFHFELFCNDRVLWRLLNGGADWPIIERLPRVSVSECRGNDFLRYTRKPFTYDTNLSVID